MNAAHIAQAAEAGPSQGNIAVQLLVIVILTAINAFFAASEMAMVSLDSNRLKEKASEGDVKAKKILRLLDDPSRFLSTIQVCITLAGFFNSASAATGIAVYLGEALESMGLPSSYTISSILITLVLSFITIVFGELIPKRIALQGAEKFAYRSVGFLTTAAKLLSPFVHLLSGTTNLFLKLFGVSTEGVEERVTLNDIKSIVQVGQSQGLINTVESEMINSIITFDDKYAEEIMTPRTEVFTIDVDDDFSEYIEEMLTLRYSRIPVYEDDVDNIIGILYIKDYLLESYHVGFDKVDLKKIIRPAYFVPERKNINELFNELQEDNRHMAVLIDEYGGFAGIVTMEDLIEEIVGDIDDEYDHDEPEIKKIDDNHFVAVGTLSMKELNFNTGADFDEESEDYDTLGGLIMYLLGRIPNDGDRPYIEYEGMTFHVDKIENKRIQRVIIEYYPEEEDKNDEEIDR